MSSPPGKLPNVKQAVPFFMVRDMESSINFYVNGLGFSMAETWIEKGKIKWCWLNIDSAAIMLQEYSEKINMMQEKPGEGVDLFYM